MKNSAVSLLYIFDLMDIFRFDVENNFCLICVIQRILWNRCFKMKNEQVKQLCFNLREFSLEIFTMAENNELKKKKKKKISWKMHEHFCFEFHLMKLQRINHSIFPSFLCRLSKHYFSKTIYDISTSCI